MARRYTYSTCLNWGGDVPTCEIDVTVSFTVSPGSPETGRFGPPELYDPGSPAEVEDIQVESIDGRPVERAPACSSRSSKSWKTCTTRCWPWRLKLTPPTPMKRRTTLVAPASTTP